MAQGEAGREMKAHAKPRLVGKLATPTWRAVGVEDAARLYKTESLQRGWLKAVAWLRRDPTSPRWILDKGAPIKWRSHEAAQ